MIDNAYTVVAIAHIDMIHARNEVLIIWLSKENYHKLLQYMFPFLHYNMLKVKV